MTSRAWGYKLYYYTRVIAATSACYGLGYQAAIIDYARDPEKRNKEMVAGLIAQSAGGDAEVLAASTPQHRYIKHVGTKILAAGKAHCEIKLAELKTLHDKAVQEMQKLEVEGDGKNTPAVTITLRVPDRLELPRDMATPASAPANTSASVNSTLSSLSSKLSTIPGLTGLHLATTLSQIEDELKFWETALLKFDKDWSFIVCRSSTTNAFVSDVCPYQVFVFTGLIEQLRLTPDELALCLAHEISHSILGHSEAKSQLEYILRQAHLLILISLPEIEWVPLQETFSAFFSTLLTSSFSRTYECEADSLGAVLAARACYDVRKGVRLLSKLQALENEVAGKGEAASPEGDSLDGPESGVAGSSGSNSSSGSNTGRSTKASDFFRSHPLSSERHENLSKLSALIYGSGKSGKHVLPFCRAVREDLEACKLARQFV